MPPLCFSFSVFSVILRWSKYCISKKHVALLFCFVFKNCHSFFIFCLLRWTLGLVLSQNDMLAESGRRNFTQKCGSGLRAARRWGGGGPDIKERRWEFRWRTDQVLSSLIRVKMMTPEVHYGQEVGLWSCGIWFLSYHTGHQPVRGKGDLLSMAACNMHSVLEFSLLKGLYSPPPIKRSFVTSMDCLSCFYVSS